MTKREEKKTEVKDFKVIYKILKAFEKAMDLDEFDVERAITAQSLGACNHSEGVGISSEQQFYEEGGEPG